MKKNKIKQINNHNLLFENIIPVVNFLMLFFIFSVGIANASVLPAIKPDSSANRIVSGIMSYTLWPEKKQLPRLCIFSSARHVQFTPDPGNTLPDKSFNVVYINDKTDLTHMQCDALYFGKETPQQQSDILTRLRGQPTQSIAENNPECTIGAVFCLLTNQSPPAFSVNLDSLSRSGVKVSPDVLLLSRKGH